jgi:hydroxymethylbilane synthase
VRDRLIIGSRGSRLARIQTQGVADMLSAACEGLEVTVREIRTSGDRDRERAVTELGVTGAFTREIEHALLSGEVDLAVHSLKDLPVEQPDGLVICATPKRADARDVLVSRDGKGLAGLTAGSVVGTSSPRRRAQLLAARPDLEVRDLRGNVDTRLDKLTRGEYDAILTAKAALDRLGRADVITETLDFLPAPGQGALAVETREGDERVMRLAAGLNDAATYVATRAERMLLAALGGGCVLPLGAFAECGPGGELTLRAVLLSEDGTNMQRAEATGRMASPREVVNKVRRRLERRNPKSEA